VYRYYEAKRMYNHYDKLVKDWGDDVPPMVEGQREYCQLEMEYFRDESIKFVKNLIAATIFGSIVFYGYFGVYLHA
jgi:hypothetical protein